MLIWCETRVSRLAVLRVLGSTLQRAHGKDGSKAPSWPVAICQSGQLPVATADELIWEHTRCIASALAIVVLAHDLTTVHVD